MVTLRRDCNRAASFASLLYAIGEAMWRGHGLLPIVVEEEKHGSERMHACIPFLGGAMPVSAFMPRTKGSMAHNLQLASWKAGTPASFEAHSLGTYPQGWRLFLWLF